MATENFVVQLANADEFAFSCNPLNVAGIFDTTVLQISAAREVQNIFNEDIALYAIFDLSGDVRWSSEQREEDLRFDGMIN